MAKKRFMITMDEDVHMALKNTANRLKINSGDVIEMMLGGGMEMATSLKVAGIRFVPVPVMNDDEYLLYRNLLEARLEKMEVKI